MRDESASLLVRGGVLVTPEGLFEEDVLILSGRIAARGIHLEPEAGVPEFDAAGLWVFPGLVDPQVHFREPGATHKEDLESGSRAAVAGGVTSFLEMPNTDPPTTDPDRLADKLARADGRAHADHAFFLGATAANAEHLAEWEELPGCAGVKVFMGSSTGGLLVPDDETLERVLRSGRRRVAVHAEDEARLQARRALFAGRSDLHAGLHPQLRDVGCALQATRRLLDLAERTGRRVHVLHVSTKEEVELLRERDLGDLVTAEVTPHHLMLAAPECYEHHGAFVQMNPPIRGLEHRDALRAALLDGVLTCLGSDHAPHTPAEKRRPYPESPSGIPGVQTTLGLCLRAVADGWLPLTEIPRVAAENPCRVYGIAGKGRLEPGYDGDLVLVDPEIRSPLPATELESRAGYSPYEGMERAGWPVATVLRGRIVWRAGRCDEAPGGRPLRFSPA